METDGGGWTFVGHLNQDYTGGTFFEADLGSYQVSRVDDGTNYGLGRTLLANIGHTGLMLLLDSEKPTVAATASKALFFTYVLGAPGFNKGPIPCSGLTGFAYRVGLAGVYTSGGTTNGCDGTQWYARNAAATQWLTAFYAAPYGGFWGKGMGGDDTYGHDVWIYIR